VKPSKLLLPASAALTALAYRRAVRSRLAPAIRIEEGVRSRHPQDLGRGLPDRADGTHRYPGRGYFEWWYFDAYFEDGHACVAGILDPDIYRLSRRSSQVFLNLYTPDGRSFHNFVDIPREKLKASPEGCRLELEGNTIRGGYPEWEVDLEHRGFAAHLRFRSELPGWALGSGELLFGSLEYPRVFGWAVPQPRAEVSGWLAYPGARVEVKGTGYHDHNWGNLAMPLYFSHWHWGRVFHPQATLVFADIATRRRCGPVRIPLLLLGLEGSLEMETCRAEWSYSDYRSDPQGAQVYPTRMACRFEERDVLGELEFQVLKELEVNDLLAHAGLPLPLCRVLGAALARPCYYRFLSGYRASLDVRGRRLELEGEAVQEYMIMALRGGRVPQDQAYRNFLPRVSPHAG